MTKQSPEHASLRRKQRGIFVLEFSAAIPSIALSLGIATKNCTAYNILVFLAMTPFFYATPINYYTINH